MYYVHIHLLAFVLNIIPYHYVQPALSNCNTIKVCHAVYIDYWFGLVWNSLIVPALPLPWGLVFLTVFFISFKICCSSFQLLLSLVWSGARKKSLQFSISSPDRVRTRCSWQGMRTEAATLCLSTSVFCGYNTLLQIGTWNFVVMFATFA